MTITTIRTQQKDWSFENNGYALIALSAKKIATGEIIAFECWERYVFDSTLMNLKGVFYIGLYAVAGRKCLRVSETTDLDGTGSHSLIPSWYSHEIITDPVFIAARIQNYFKVYTDIFLYEQK